MTPFPTRKEIKANQEMFAKILIEDWKNRQRDRVDFFTKHDQKVCLKDNRLDYFPPTKELFFFESCKIFVCSIIPSLFLNVQHLLITVSHENLLGIFL